MLVDITPKLIKEISLEKLFERDSLDPSFGDVLGGMKIGADQMQADNVNLKTKQTSDTNITIGPNDGEIQDYLDKLSAVGGGNLNLLAGTFYPTKNVTIPTNIRFLGAGKDNTIIDFADAAYGVTIIGTLASLFKNNKVSDLTIQNSNATAGLDIDYADYFTLNNVRVTSCEQKGIRIQRSQYWNIKNSDSDGNTGSCFEIRGDSIRITKYFSLNNCFAKSIGAGEVGYLIHAEANKLFYGKFIGCTASLCSGDGFDIDADSASALITTFIGCLSTAGGAKGFDSSIRAQQVSFIACQSLLNTGNDFEISGALCEVVACQTDGVYVLENTCVFIGNTIASGADPSSGVTIGTGNIQSLGNLFEGTRTRRIPLIMKNTSGGALSNGNVVVLKSVATGDEITTTTSVGDNKVFGMLNGAGNNNEWKPVLVEGMTTVLKVNGTIDIAIGDYLCCHSDAGIAQKANTTGQMVFAVALEAYSTDDSNGIIDAYILRNRFPLN